MIINDLLEKEKMSRYRLSKESGVAMTTITDICNGKADLDKCTAGTLHKIAKVLNVTVDSILENNSANNIDYRCSFETFKSNTCHHVKDMGDIDFIIETLETDEVRKLYESDVPIFAICLGHQLMALATGAETYKLKYGHRGGNHPVKDLETGRVYISSQNHGYAVNMETVDPKIAKEAFVNVNDGTNEGLKYVGKNIFTVQYHPEACPGPQDSGYLFDRFLRMMEEGK